jgi:hypothetical protein
MCTAYAACLTNAREMQKTDLREEREKTEELLES